MLTLAEALKTKRLQDFIAQEEACGVGPVDRTELDNALSKVISKKLQISPLTSVAASKKETQPLVLE
jgi:hypothetical protein